MLRILVLFAALALGGCVITPDYRAGAQGYYDDAYHGVAGVYIGGYGADNYYRYYDAGYLGFTQSWPWYANACPGYGYAFDGYAGWGCGGIYGAYNPFQIGFGGPGWGWGGYWGLGGYPWGGYWNNWGYAPHYWFLNYPDRRDRDVADLHAEKVRFIGSRNAQNRGAAAALASERARANRTRAGADSRRDRLRRESVRREAARSSTTWHRPWPGNAPARNVERRPQRAPVDRPINRSVDRASRDLDSDALRHHVPRPQATRPHPTRPQAPRGWPERRSSRSTPAPTVSRTPVRAAPPRPTATRIPSAPTRSFRPAPRVRATPAARSGRSHTRSSTRAVRSSSVRSAPRGTPSQDDSD